MAGYPVPLDKVKEAVAADNTPEGPHLTPAQNAAQSYLLSEMMCLVGFLQLAGVFLELLPLDYEGLVRQLNEKGYYQQWRAYIENSILNQKKAEYLFAQNLAAAKAAQAGGGEAVKQLPAGANAGEGSLY